MLYKGYNYYSFFKQQQYEKERFFITATIDEYWRKGN